MSDKVDARGRECPQPVIMTKKALERMEQGVVTVYVDNEVSRENVLKFAKSQACEASFVQEAGDFVITITKGLSLNQELKIASPDNPVPDWNSNLKQAGMVYVFTKNTLGSGNEELGKILLNSFFVALRESTLPESLIFLNSGVYLTTEGSTLLEPIQTLEQAGVAVLSCGTCLDYYKLKEKLAVGSITNMYTILEQMQNASQVITL